ncbi:MAG: cytidylyltransferase family protein [Micavibrio sp.]|nr:cytidylyltransferase family protein [Micavibrio sp.]
MKIAIVIPARYASTRFPGKPLALIGGKSMVQRVYELAQAAATGLDNVEILIATEDQRIADHAAGFNAPCVLTSENCPTGSDRVLAAILQMQGRPDFVVNLQGDAPFTPVAVVRAVIEEWMGNPELSVVTPIVALRWKELDTLRDNKSVTPFSGTTCVTNEEGRALWFSKNIIPAIRRENRDDEFSPVHQHIGLYGFRTDILEKFVTLPEGRYEKIEGLEQLRLIENDIPVQTVTVAVDLGMAQSGIDSVEDLARAEILMGQGGNAA